VEDQRYCCKTNVSPFLKIRKPKDM